MSGMDLASATKETFRQMFNAGKRFDGRGVFDHRPIEVSYDVSNKAEGSVRIKVGKTDVAVGVKMTVGTPYPDSPDKGNLTVSGDLLPLASPRYESGPPGFDAVELPRLVDRAIRESGMIDFKKLVIVPGEKVWTVIIDVYPLNDDGNVIDVATLGATLALQKTIVPALSDKYVIDYDTKSTKKLPLNEGILPISFSFYKLGSALILDPTREEEEACDTRITFAGSRWNGQLMLNSCQKKGEIPLASEDIAKMMEIIPKKFDELNTKLKKLL